MIVFGANRLPGGLTQLKNPPKSRSGCSGLEIQEPLQNIPSPLSKVIEEDHEDQPVEDPLPPRQVLRKTRLMLQIRERAYFEVSYEFTKKSLSLHCWSCL